jgi:hypothetical protein
LFSLDYFPTNPSTCQDLLLFIAFSYASDGISKQ